MVEFPNDYLGAKSSASARFSRFSTLDYAAQSRGYPRRSTQDILSHADSSERSLKIFGRKMARWRSSADALNIQHARVLNHPSVLNLPHSPQLGNEIQNLSVTFDSRCESWTSSEFQSACFSECQWICTGLKIRKKQEGSKSSFTGAPEKSVDNLTRNFEICASQQWLDFCQHLGGPAQQLKYTLEVTKTLYGKYKYKLG